MGETNQPGGPEDRQTQDELAEAQKPSAAPLESSQDPQIDFNPNAADPTVPIPPIRIQESVTDDEAIEFRGSHDEKLAQAGRDGEMAGQAAAHPAAQGAAAGFEIEGFDEERAPAAGHLFAEPAPEPPPQPYEILAQPKPFLPRFPLRRRPARTESESLQPAEPKLDSPLPHLWVRLIWGFMPLMLLLAGYALVIFTQKEIGYAWDEAYYYVPSQSAADWLVEVLRGNRPFDAQSIGNYWGKKLEDDMHPEHPGLQKLLSGISMRAFGDTSKQIWAMRFPVAVLFGLTLTLIYMLGRRTWGPVPGLIAALMYATMPHVFGYAHFASLETPLNFMMLFVVFCFLRGLDSPIWAVFTGLSFGLLLDTKINGFLLPIPLILWAHLYARRKYINNLFAMCTLGPLTMIAAWPWLWHDPIMHLLQYLAYHATHQQTALYFMGKVWGYGKTNAPWFYPLAMIGVTLPLSGMALIAYGLARTVRLPHRRPISALFLLCAWVPLTVASLPSVPKYDGVRLILPVFPFLALLGGSGVAGLTRHMDRFLTGPHGEESARRRNPRRWILGVIATILVLDGGGAIWRYYPYLLSYFNPVVGGLKGAAERGFEVTYWGETLNRSVLDRIKKLPGNSSLKPLALNQLCLDQQREWEWIPPSIRISGASPYDYHIIQMRRGFFGPDEKALVDSGRFQPIEGGLWAKFGVPLIAIYRTGPQYDEFRQAYKQKLQAGRLPPSAP